MKLFYTVQIHVVFLKVSHYIIPLLSVLKALQRVGSTPHLSPADEANSFTTWMKGKIYSDYLFSKNAATFDNGCQVDLKDFYLAVMNIF